MVQWKMTLFWRSKLQSINEEYRATTEELEASKEELQSVNEELETLNEELKNKIEELGRVNSDLKNLLDSAAIEMLFLDRELKIRRFTPNLIEFFNIRPSDRGRPVDDLTDKLDYPEMTRDAKTVLKNLVPVEREIRRNDGRWYLARLRPYRTEDDRIDGVVMTFVDIARLKEVEWRLEARTEFARKTIDAIREGLLVRDSDLRVKSASESFYDLFEVPRDQTEGRLVYELGNGQWDILALRKLLEEILPQQNTFNDFEVEHDFETIGHRVMILNARGIDHEQLILLAIEDVTEREKAKAILERENEWLEGQVRERTKELRRMMHRLMMAEQSERDRISHLLHDDLQQRLFALKLDLSSFGNSVEDGSSAKERIDNLAGQLTETMKLARDLTADLSPVGQDKDLKDLAEEIAARTGRLYNLRVTLNVEDRVHITQHSLRLHFQQALQELLFNVVKHAGTDRASVEIKRVENKLVVDVADQGKGFDPEEIQQKTRSFGLKDLRERLKMVKGRLQAQSTPARGTRVSIYLPLAAEEPGETE